MLADSAVTMGDIVVMAFAAEGIAGLKAAAWFADIAGPPPVPRVGAGIGEAAGDKSGAGGIPAVKPTAAPAAVGTVGDTGASGDTAVVGIEAGRGDIADIGAVAAGNTVGAGRPEGKRAAGMEGLGVDIEAAVAKEIAVGDTAIVRADIAVVNSSEVALGMGLEAGRDIAVADMAVVLAGIAAAGDTVVASVGLDIALGDSFEAASGMGLAVGIGGVIADWDRTVKIPPRKEARASLAQPRP